MSTPGAASTVTVAGFCGDDSHSRQRFYELLAAVLHSIAEAEQREAAA